MLETTLPATLAHRALDAAVNGVVICDMRAPNAPMTYVNPAFERITGYSAREMIGRNCRLLQGPETDPAEIAALSKAITAGQECRVTLRNHRADGTTFWNEVSLSPVRDEHGVVVEYIGIQNDVTERRDAGDAATLLQHADSAMYQAKAKDGSRWAVFGSPVELAAPSAPAPPIAETTAPAASEPATGDDLAAAFDALLTGAGPAGLRSLYQPLVELDSGEVVGYEALARGPEGSPFARPDELFAYARRTDRLGELDWACRAAAIRGALEGGLPSPLRLFVNVEPEALGVPCPPQHRAVWDRASDLDVVVEVTERALTSRPADLLHALEAFRELGWSIALDDVGADSRSLALLPLLRPDVVKLDLRLIQARPDRAIAEIVAAVNAYAERTGAVVLAEGIETDAHLATAQSIGASHGQGWRFGRPEPLPSVLSTAARALPAAPRAAQVAGETPYGVVAQVLPVRRATKPLLLEMSWHLERQAHELGETALLVAAFQTAERFTPATRRRYGRLADRIAFVAGLGIGLDSEPAPGVRGATLADDDPLANEWSVVVLGPHFAGALVAIDLGDEAPDDERRFDYTLTYDRDLVMTAANALMRRVQPVG